MLVGGGSVRSGGLDIGNLMKPALARGQLHCIGATTLDEHRKYFEKDAALERRFQPVMVQEPSPAEALVILEGLKVSAACLVMPAGFCSRYFLPCLGSSCQHLSQTCLQPTPCFIVPHESAYQMRCCSTCFS